MICGNQPRKLIPWVIFHPDPLFFREKNTKRVMKVVREEDSLEVIRAALGAPPPQLTSSPAVGLLADRPGPGMDNQGDNQKQ